MNASSSATPPPMSWQYCGDQIKLWRARAGVTREALATEAGYSYESLRSMEAGRRKPSLHLLQVADEMCGAKGILLAGADYLKPEKYPRFAEDYIRNEGEAVVINWYENQLFPGLLQTAATAKTVIDGRWPPLDDETVAVRVAARLERQELLKVQSKAFNFVIEENVLHRRLSTEEAHVEQLLHLLVIGRQRNVAIQIVPSVGFHPGLEGPFVLLDLPEHERLAYEEGQAAGMLHADTDKVQFLSQRHERILRQALTREKSAEFINALVEDQ
ncbi:Scr1 family TA system antitoxin-like transcriptional regulator [Kitasatospora sp. NPDC059827]|uniref:helix-turn-helix domain-containing protein n=1 Tax=Kitasatospora sp. NPDC059827 TaxID=3346964 RepID=UPI003658B122